MGEDLIVRSTEAIARMVGGDYEREGYLNEWDWKHGSRQGSRVGDGTAVASLIPHKVEC